MLTRPALLGIRVPRRVLVVAGLILVAGVFFGGPVAKHLSVGGSSDPHAVSSKAKDLLAARFNAGEIDLVSR